MSRQSDPIAQIVQPGAYRFPRIRTFRVNTDSALILQIADLPAKLGLHVADHLGGRAIAELFRQLAASRELALYRLFFPVSIHEDETPGKAQGSMPPREELSTFSRI
jgi:hypothetical protein